MAESMPVSDIMLARYVAGDLTGEQLTRVERALGEIPGLAARLEQIKSERAAFLAQGPADAFAHRVVTRLTVERPARRPLWQVWWLLPPVGVATALLLCVVYQHALGPQGLTRSAGVTTDDQYELAAAQQPPGEPLREEPSNTAQADAPLDAKPEVWVAEKNEAPQKQPKAQSEALKSKEAADGDGRNKGRAADPRFAEPPPPPPAPNADLEALGSVRDEARRRASASADGKASRGGAAGIGSGAGPSVATKPVLRAEPAPAAAAPKPAKPAQLEEEDAVADKAKKTEARQPSERKSVEAQAAKDAPATPPPSTPPSTPAPVAAPATTTAPSGGFAAPGEAEVQRPYAQAPAREEASKTGKSAKADMANDRDDLARAATEGASTTTQITLTRDQAGGSRAITNNDVVTASSVLKVTATGGSYVTVVGIRRDGKPHVYGQSTAKQGAHTVAVRLRPASSRVTEAIFVIVGDSAPTIGPNVVAGAKDAAQLPIRLAVPGTQRRYVIVVAAELGQ